jgi:hypothetical protein
MHDQTATMQKRYDDIMRWLGDEAPYTAADQKHLRADTPERAYWHFGYAAALRDVIALLRKSDQK